MFFSKLIDSNFCATDEMVEFMKKAFSIDIHVGAKCTFEYKDTEDSRFTFDVLGKKEYEGTSFDFHIQDGDVEVFFEIKFTEDGFGKAKDDAEGRHVCKAKQYKNLLPHPLKREMENAEILKHYQLIRNIIRAENDNKYVIFITDANNPSTNKAISVFKNKFGKYLDPKYVIFETWQELGKKYPDALEFPYQFKAIQSDIEQ